MEFGFKFDFEFLYLTYLSFKHGYLFGKAFTKTVERLLFLLFLKAQFRGKFIESNESSLFLL